MSFSLMSSTIVKQHSISFFFIYVHVFRGICSITVVSRLSPHLGGVVVVFLCNSAVSSGLQGCPACSSWKMSICFKGMNCQSDFLSCNRIHMSSPNGNITLFAWSLKEYFDIFWKDTYSFTVESQVSRLIPLLCLYSKFGAAASFFLA